MGVLFVIFVLIMCVVKLIRFAFGPDDGSSPSYHHKSHDVERLISSEAREASDRFINRLIRDEEKRQARVLAGKLRVKHAARSAVAHKKSQPRGLSSRRSLRAR